MTKLTLFIFLSALASCSKKILPSIETETTMKSDTVYVTKSKIIKIPGDTVTVKTSLPCPEGEYHTKVAGTHSRMNATVDLSKGQLTVVCNSDSLQERIDWLEQHTNNESVIKKTITITHPPKRFIPKWVWYLVGFTVLYWGARMVFFMYNIPIRI